VPFASAFRQLTLKIKKTLQILSLHATVRHYGTSMGHRDCQLVRTQFDHIKLSGGHQLPPGIRYFYAVCVAVEGAEDARAEVRTLNIFLAINH
jgi:hypothetical protein